MKHRSGKLDDEVMQKFKEKSNTIIQNMSATIEDFKNFFQPDKIQETFKVNEAIKGAVRFVSDAYNQHSIKVSVQREKIIIIKSYKNELMQVFLNILNNTKDAVVENNVKNPTLKIATQERESQLVITLLLETYYFQVLI